MVRLENMAARRLNIVQVFMPLEAKWAVPDGLFHPSQGARGNQTVGSTP